MAYRFNHRITADIVPMDTAEEDEEEDGALHIPNLKRNLLGDFGRPSVLEPPIPHEHMKVFLRIRPFSKEEQERKEDQQCLGVETDHTVLTNAPKDSHFFKNMSRGSCKTSTRFTFSKIFNENTSQKDFFGSTMLGLVKDFIEGQNCLVFTYGVTSSGKTYTIQGNPKDAGILPRALDVLFNSINRRQWDGMDLKPKFFVDVTRLTPEQEMMERKVKERVLKLSCDDDLDVMSLLGDDASDISTATNITTCSESSNMSTLEGKGSLDGSEHLFDELETRIREESKVSVDNQGQVKFSVWVSFAEIYNEQIYDLLEPVPPKKKNYKRPCLKLSEDKNGSPYIKGLKYIQVNSADEAYKLLTIGQRNLQTACTKLNHNSSRSHCIFNIKIIRVIDKDNPHAARISMLTLCDLAGSERYGKTQTSGERLKEAGNINTSLLTLGRCIETLRHNQAHKEQKRIVPFRESKLTRLFQNFFVGQGKAAMIVNVNQLASMFDETMHVFKFSAIASKVEVQQKPVFIKPKLPVAPAPAQIPRTSISWATPAKNTKLCQHEAENMPLPEDDDLEDDLDDEQPAYTQENIDELLGIIEQLQTDLENEVHSRYKHEKMIRKEVCDEMMKQFTEIEEQCSERIRIREQRAEELAEKRLQIVLDAERAKRKEYMTDAGEEWVSSVILHQEKVKVEQRDETIKELRDEIASLKAQTENETSTDTENVRSQVEQYEKQIKDFEEQLKKEKEKSQQVDELLEKVSKYDEKIKSLEEEVSKKDDCSIEESSKADLVENLTQQLQQTRQQIKDQEKEIGELNDMLTEAGETFEQKEVEIAKLKELTTEYEKRMETQAEALSVLERAAADSKVAMETADESLSKREECVSSLQAEIRQLEGDVNKYRNKARFFEEQIVETEHEALQWKQKYEKDLSDHASSQEALIHGFNAEISNLKSQIFHFKSQLYGVKSPLKSPGGTLRSPDVKMRLFPMSPINSSGRDKDLNASGSNSPVKDKDVLKNNVNEQVKALQREMDKNCKMITDLESALQISRSTVEDFEIRFATVSEKCRNAESRVIELETELKNKENVVVEKPIQGASVTGNGNEAESISNTAVLAEKDKEIEELKKKVKELEPLMTDYFSTAKKLTESDKKIREMTEVLEERESKIAEFTGKIRDLENGVSGLKEEIKEKELASEKAEEKFEIVETLNNELKGMLDKTATDLQVNEKELLVLSPRSEKEPTDFENNQNVDNMKEEVTKTLKEIEDLKTKLSSMKTAYKEKDIALKEAIEKGNELEFKNSEIDIENEELKKSVDAQNMKIEDLQYELEKNLKEVQTTGEELAVKSVESEKSRRMVDELKASISDLESAVADKEVELCEKDKIIDDKNNEIFTLRKENECKGPVVHEKEGSIDIVNENEQLKKDLNDLKSEHEKILNDRDAKSKEISKITEEISNLTTEKTQLKEKMDDLELEVLSLREELYERDTDLEEINNRMNEIKSQTLEYQDKNKQIEGEVAVLKKRVADLLDKSNEKDFDIQEKAEKITKLELQLGEKEKDDAALHENIEELKGEISKLERQVTEKETENNALRNNINDLKEDTISKLELQLSEKENENTALRESIDKLKDSSNEESNSKLSEALLEIAELKSAVYTQKALHHKVKGELEEALLTIENGRGELEGLRKQLTSIKENESALKTKVEELESKIEKNNEEKEGNSVTKINEIETELKQKTDEIECAERIVGEMKELLKRRDEQLAELHNELRTVNTNTERINKEFESRKERILELENDVVEKETMLSCVQVKLRETEEQLSAKTDKLSALEEANNTNSNQFKTLTDQITAVEEEKNLLEKNLNSKIEFIQNESNKLKEKLKESYRTSADKEASVRDLNDRIEGLMKENNEIKNELLETKQYKDRQNELKSQLSLKEVECETLNLELKVLKEDLAKEIEKYVTVKEQLEGIQKLSGDVTDSRHVMNDENKDSDNEHLEKLKEIQRLYESEKQKNEEYKLLVSETGEMNCLSPMSGARKLRKEKIELENNLIEAKYKVTSLETKVSNLEVKLKNVQNAQEAVPSHDPLLQRKFNSVTVKLQETENTNKSLIKEVTQLQGLAERLQEELKEEQEKKDVPTERDVHRRSRASILQTDIRQSISSPLSKNLELARTKEREQCLKEQLTEANSKIQEWLGKLSDTENKLQVKTQELKHAKDTIQQLEVRNSQEGRNVDRQIEEYMELNNTLKLQILKKEGELECSQRSLHALQRQLDSEVGLMKTFEQDKKSQEEMIGLLKETLKDQEDMLQEQEDFLNSKEAELQTCQSEHKALLDRYQLLLDSKDSKTSKSSTLESERNLKEQLSAMEEKYESVISEKDGILHDLKGKLSVVKETEKKLEKARNEKERLQSVIRENNQELKAMESSLTEARKEVEELKSHGADKFSDIHLEEVKRDAEKSAHDLHTKIRNLQCHNKELSFKLSATEEKMNSLLEDKHNMEHKLKDFREERDKLVSGLEAVLKKKDSEIKQHKDMIKQLKEKEIQITKNWQIEREQVAAGLQNLNENTYRVKSEPPQSPQKPAAEDDIYHKLDPSQNHRSPARQSSKRGPPRPSPPKLENLKESPEHKPTEIQTLNSSPGSCRRGSQRVLTETPVSESQPVSQGSARAKRGSSRKAKKRPSSEGLENLPPLPKRRNKEDLNENSNVSESDDYSTHLQVDATPPVAAKTLRRTRKRNGSQLDLSKAEETDSAPRRSTRNKRSTKQRLLSSFRESPMGRTSKRILDSIAETFSPKSPTRSPTKSPLREDNSGGNLASGEKRGSREMSVESQDVEKKRAGPSRGRHRLYKEDTYISEPFESTGDFVQSPEDIHKSVTRSLRSRRH